MAQPPRETENELLLKRSVTFKAPAKTPAPQDANLITKVWGSSNAPATKVSESLDYETVQNKIQYERMKIKQSGKKKLYGYTGHTLAKFLVTFAIGVITGLFAVALGAAVQLITHKKLAFIQNRMDEYIEEDGDGKPLSIFIGFLWYWLFGGLMVSLATSMVQYWAPASAGAGVTLVMAYLNGNHIPNLLRFSTLITKYVGTVCAVSSGLPMGPEGPMVHIGACVASVICYLDFKPIVNGKAFGLFGKLKIKEVNFKEKLKVLDEIVSDQDHREFVSAGVSAGISAAFGAPVGGVLFSMEEACSFWSRKTAWRCFIAATLSTYTIQIVNQSTAKGMIAFSNVKPLAMYDWLKQLPFFLVDFAMAGLLGAAFNSVRMWLWKLRAAKTLHLQRIAEVVGLVFLVGAFGFFFAATAGTCLPVPDDWYEKEEVEDEGYLACDDPERKKGAARGEPEYGVRFTCEDGFHNDVATLFLSSTHHTIVALFSMGKESAVRCSQDDYNMEHVPFFTIGALALYCTVYLILMSIGAGLAIPGGLFMPSIVLGASWGGMWGYIILKWLKSWPIYPGLYALLAATGVLGGVFRSAISLVVLMVEGTRGVDYIFGLILAVVVANWVAHHIHHDGVYESELERIGNVYMLRDEPPHRLQTITTESMMATGVYGFKTVENVAHILHVLRSTSHNGFPVWARESDLEAGEVVPGEDHSKRLEGLILRTQLLVLLQRRHFVDADGNPVGREFNEKYELELETEMRTFFRRYYTHSRFVSATAQPLDSLMLDVPGSGVDIDNLYLDLRPYMNRAPFTINKDSSASRSHQVFLSLGLRHLIVVDQHNNVVGIITRKDLDHAAGHGWWRLSHVADPPKNKGMLGVFSKIPSVGFFKNLVGPSSANVASTSGANGELHGHSNGSGPGHH
mmetsp:Transcript_19521/g.42325  ORF Transcript_19521/g.42325 Transcript_19521/m.42325 type:complete len:908 (+) Transcript_19521:79-2802(+)|eukprot:CAMPEP_0202919978 /NCGR_PEP_ID=MMETSP1392-20130828/76609_1 /ASSEMBLY_ACC=CAM_ASM_000868 /TAXON_ID=225041 /ORGANISM="Chlamydomonas chlamydogama, Strain SAG 11-48b" /LENGTH=907 /DNA_ID=CAMNT_0049613451 /DNA_START=78 /DNA_END=2801 /DNA_ORIENTATION=-